MDDMYVFLDVDGVLNCHLTRDRTPNGYVGLDESKIELLAAFVRETGAKVVLNAVAKGKQIGRPRKSIETIPDKFWKYRKM